MCAKKHVLIFSSFLDIWENVEWPRFFGPPCRLSIVTMSLTAAVWLQFATQVFRGGIGRLTCIGSNVNKQVTTFTFRVQATTCSKYHTRTVVDAGCECAPWVRSANPSDSWALVFPRFRPFFHSQ